MRHEKQMIPTSGHYFIMGETDALVIDWNSEMMDQAHCMFGKLPMSDLIQNMGTALDYDLLEAIKADAEAFGMLAYKALEYLQRCETYRIGQEMGKGGFVVTVFRANAPSLYQTRWLGSCDAELLGNEPFEMFTVMLAVAGHLFRENIRDYRPDSVVNGLLANAGL